MVFSKRLKLNIDYLWVIPFTMIIIKITSFKFSVMLLNNYNSLWRNGLKISSKSIYVNYNCKVSCFLNERY